MSYSTGTVQKGTQSLKQHFLGGNIQGGTYTDRYFGTATEELWSRYYVYLDNFVVNETQTKMMFHGEEGSYPSFWWGMLFGQAALSVQVQGIKGGTDTLNVYGPAIPQNRWVCIETHIKMSSPGVANGIVEAWIDGAQGIARYDVPMRDAVASGRNNPAAKMTFNRLYVQYGGGDLYYDSVAMGDQRIGCAAGGGSTSDTTPPRPPVGLTAR